MYHTKYKVQSTKYKNFRKSFTLIEVIVVMAVMGLIIGGLLVSMRQIIEGEMLLRRMQAVEEESRFIMDLFAQDAQYSELDASYKPSQTNQDSFSQRIQFLLTQSREDLGGGGSVGDVSDYFSYPRETAPEYFFQRTLTGTEQTVATLNNTPLGVRPLFRVRKIVSPSPDSVESYIITISLTFRVEKRGDPILVPIQTSIVSRTFEI